MVKASCMCKTKAFFEYSTNSREDGQLNDLGLVIGLIQGAIVKYAGSFTAMIDALHSLLHIEPRLRGAARY